MLIFHLPLINLQKLTSAQDPDKMTATFGYAFYFKPGRGSPSTISHGLLNKSISGSDPHDFRSTFDQRELKIIGVVLKSSFQ